MRRTDAPSAGGLAFPSYTSVLTICSTSSCPSATLLSPVLSTKSHIWSSDARFFVRMNLRHCCLRTSMNSESYSCSVYLHMDRSAARRR